jgi:hypothetical protein
VPEEFGRRPPLDYLTLALVLEEIAAGDGGTSTAISVTNCPVNAILMRYGNAQQKRDWLAPLARGEMLGAFCLTEPHVGSDASALRTTAVKDGDEYVINGVKQFITSGKNGQVAIVIAVTDKGAGKKGMSAFLVPTSNTPGYVVARLEDKLGQHSSDTAQINFDNCRIPAENLIGAEGEGYKIALGALEGGRIGIAAQSVGMARSAFEAALAYSKERESFGTTHLQPPGRGLPPGRLRHADRGRAPAHLARRRAARRGPALPEGSRHGQAVCQRDGRARVQRRHPDAGRLRRGERLPGGAHLPRRACVPDLRRHERRAEDHHPAGAGLRRRVTPCGASRPPPSLASLREPGRGRHQRLGSEYWRPLRGGRWPLGRASGCVRCG